MHGWKMKSGVAALVAAGVAGIALPGMAQKEKGSASKVDSIVGFVDVAQVTDEIQKTQAWSVNVKKLNDERAKLKDEFESLVQIRYLTPVEKKELQDLSARTKPSDAEKARIEALKKKSDTLDAESNQLAQIEKPTEVQKTRIDTLRKLREEAIGALQDEKNKRQQALDKLQVDMLEDLQQKIIKIVQQVADSRGIVMVLDRQAILYGGQDLTQDVIKKWPK